MKYLLLLKADSIPSNARWITVHSSPGAKGQPLLIQPQPDGSHRVIGGAGGSLNYLKLRGVKSVSDYKKDAKSSADKRKEERKAKMEADKAAGTHEAKVEARKDIKTQKRKAEADIISAVAKMAGWDQKSLEFPEEDYAHLSEKAQEKVRAKFHNNLLKKAKDVIKQSRQKLVDSASARADAGIGELPFSSESPDAVSVEDLAPVKPLKSSLGFQTDYKERAEANGLTQAEAAAEALEVKQSNLTPEQKLEVMAKPGKAADAIKAELEGIKEPAAPSADVSLISAKDALELVKVGKKLSLIEKAARAANEDVDNAKSEPKAFVLEVSDDVDAAVKEDLANDLRTAQTKAFLSEVGEIAGANPNETLGGHLGVGAYNSINSLALAVGGDALIDRSVLDVLGVAGAAQVLARRFKADLDDAEFQHVADGIQDFHLNHYMGASTEALKKARDLTDAAKAIKVPDDAVNGVDLAVAQDLNNRRRNAVGDAQRILGQALGEMEANAALVVAMKGPSTNDFEVSLGKMSPEQAITQVRAIGLSPKDYTLEKVGDDTFLTVKHEGMQKLAKPVAAADLAQVRRNLEIVSGKYDEDNWLPLGVANRPDLAMDVPVGVADRLAQPFQPGADLEQSLKTYIGARTADGDAPADIVADIQSADFFQKVGAGRFEEYRNALDAVAPLKGEDGKMQRAESLEQAFDSYADDHVASLGGDRSTLNKQKIEVDQVAVDALHRALSESPDGVVAYKQIGELTNKDQRTLREHFYQNIAKEDANAGALRKELEEHIGNEPEKESTDMFGDTAINPDWSEWKSHRDNLAQKVNESTLTWSKYIATMGGNEKAYEAVQDIIRSKMASKFAETYNKLNPNSPIKLGKRTIRNNLNHLDAVDPNARAERAKKDKELVDSLRERVGGKYAAGGVADKIDKAKEQQAAFEQSQMGFFSSEDMFGGGEGEQAPKATPLASDERHTLGHVMEGQIAGMMGVVGQNFKPGQPTKLWGVSMSGKYAAQQRAIKLLTANQRMVLAAGAGCVHGATMLRCEKTGISRSFYEWWLSGDLPWVWSRTKEGKMVVAQASRLFVKGYEQMVALKTSNGATIVVTPAHRVLTKLGWAKVSDLTISDKILAFGEPENHVTNSALDDVTQVSRCFYGDASQSQPSSRDPLESIRAPFVGTQSPTEQLPVHALFVALHQTTACKVSDLSSSKSCPLASTSAPCQSTHGEGVLHLCQTTAGLMGRYSDRLRQCGELPHGAKDNVSICPPSLGDVQEHSRLPAHLGDLGTKQGCTRQHQQFCRPAMQHSVSPVDRQTAAWGLEGEPLRQEPAESSRPVSCLSETRKVVDHGTDDAVPHGKFVEHDVPYWVLVTELESYGSCIVFDITIPIHENYVAHGLIHHNSGKTNMMLGAHSHLSGLGKVKRSLMLVPSIVQGQFNGEALRLLEPGKFKTHIQPGAPQAERIAAYKDEGTHIAVMTHQSFRDDMVHLGAKHAGIEEAEMVKRLQGMTPMERKQWVADTWEKEGINFDASFVDEAHDTLNRAGKENSSLSNVVEAVGHHTPYHVYASGDPVKNDVSEIHSMLHKMDPVRYANRAEFMRRYGADTIASKQALQREMARYSFPTSIRPDVQVTRTEERVPLSAGQTKAMSELDDLFAKAAKAQKAGKVDVATVKAISPGSFRDVPESEHEAIAAKLQKSIGVLRSSAVNRIINSHPDNAKVARAVEIVKERGDKQGVVFARNRESVEQYKAALEKAGKRVVIITGSDSAKDKDAKRRMFNPDSGKPEADIMIASDAGAVGMNLQSGQYLIQHDVSQTAKTHSQRDARIYRLGQKNGVELIDLVGDHPEETKARQRLAKKYALKDMMASPLDGLDDSGIAGAIKARRDAAENNQGSMF